MVVYCMVYAGLLLPPFRKHQDSKKEEEKKKPHIKKPLNAFMLYMKEMRAKVVAECTLKESAAINQILGRRVGGPSIEKKHKNGPCVRWPFSLHYLQHLRPALPIAVWLPSVKTTVLLKSIWDSHIPILPVVADTARDRRA